MNSVWIIPIEKKTNRKITSESSAPNDSGCDVSRADSPLPETFSTAVSAPSSAAVHSTSRHPSCYPRHTNLDSLMQPLTLGERLNLARLHYVTVTNIFRLICVSFCTFWFVFVATLTVKDFLNHDTIVYLNYKTPNTSKPPGVTICTHNILSGFSSKTLPNLSAWSVLTEDDPAKIPHTLKNIDLECIIFPDTKMPEAQKHYYKCEDLVPVLLSMQEGHRCFTYFSDIFGQTTRNIKKNPQLELSFDRGPQIQLYVTGNFLFGVGEISQKILLENRSHNEPLPSYSGVYLALHDSTILPDMLGLGFHQLKPFYITSFPFNKRVQILIEPPYNPCRKYSSLENKYSTAKIASPEMYRTRGECFVHCQWKMLNNSLCANYYSIFTKEIVQKENSMKMAKNLLDLVKSSQVLLNSSVEFNIESTIKMCPWRDNSFYDYAHSKQSCLKSCPLPCTEVTYDETHMIEYSNPDQGSLAVITWAPQPVLHIENKRKWDGFVDFVGTLGGQLHVWLGFSIITAISWFFAAIKLHASSYF